MLHPVTITEEQQEFYRREGFLKLRNCLGSDWIVQLQESLDRICHDPERFPDLIQSVDAAGNAFVSGVDQLLLKEEPLFTALLGSPMLLSIAEAICGPDFFPVQEFAVIKKSNDTSIVDWHQDVVSSSVGTTCMIGIYLDAADEQNGALRIVPGSQHQGTEICTLKMLPSQVIAMEPGDILVHDLMVAHSSGALTDFPQRRVVYFEFMNTAGAIADKVYPASFLNARTQLLPIAMHVFGKAYPQANPYHWRHKQRAAFSVPEFPEEAIVAIHANRREIKPANYCFDFHRQR